MTKRYELAEKIVDKTFSLYSILFTVERIIKSSLRDRSQRTETEYSLYILQRFLLSGHNAASIYYRNRMEGETINPEPFSICYCFLISLIISQIPVCEKTIDKGIYEEKLWRVRIAEKCLTNDSKDLHKEIFATALKLFAVGFFCDSKIQVIKNLSTHALCSFPAKLVTK